MSRIHEKFCFYSHKEERLFLWKLCPRIFDKTFSFRENFLPVNYPSLICIFSVKGQIRAEITSLFVGQSFTLIAICTAPRTKPQISAVIYISSAVASLDNHIPPTQPARMNHHLLPSAVLVRMGLENSPELPLAWLCTEILYVVYGFSPLITTLWDVLQQETEHCVTAWPTHTLAGPGKMAGTLVRRYSNSWSCSDLTQILQGHI